MTTEQTEPVRPLRADARRNRERILEAAVEVFSEQGVDAQIDDVARRADLGVGTIYRHFPTKDALIAELVRQKFRRFAENAREALADDAEPFEAVAGLLRPEAWVLGGLYWLYLFRHRDWPERVKLAALVAAAPLVWALMDLIVTGDALHSLHGTSDLAAAVGRRRDVSDAPYWTVQYFAYTLRQPLGVGMPIGLAFAVIHRDRFGQRRINLQGDAPLARQAQHAGRRAHRHAARLERGHQRKLGALPQ